MRNLDNDLQRVHADEGGGEPSESFDDLGEGAVLDKLHHDVQRLL